jgi:hypothetical protein
MQENCGRLDARGPQRRWFQASTVFRMQKPLKAPHAPKGDPALARAALLRFGDKNAPVDLELADFLLKNIAAHYNETAEEGMRDARTAALASVAEKAGSYAMALRALAEVAPHFPGGLLLIGRGANGERHEVWFMGELFQAAGIVQPDAVDIAFGPELMLPHERRPKPIFGPAIGRALAMQRLAAEHAAEESAERGPGRLNDARDGRSAKDTLAEACYLLVAGGFGPAGAAKIKTTGAAAKGHATKAPRLFPNFLAAMHRYATKETVDPAAFDRSVKKIIPALRQELVAAPEWFGWIQAAIEPSAKEASARQTALFLARLFNPRAKPPVKSVS